MIIKNAKKLKIAHLHVWDQHNKGDVGIVLAVQELLFQKFPGCQIKDFPLTILQDGKKKEITDINKADLVVIGGGGIFYSYFLPYNKKIIKAIKKPIILFGVGYIREVDAPKLSSRAINSATFLIQQAKLVGVRDNNTKKFFVQHGADKNKIKVIGDPAILLSEKKSNLKLNGQIKIGLNLNYSGWLGFGRWQSDILPAYQEIAEYFQRKYQAQVYYLQHHPGEDKIYPELKIKNLEVINLPPHQQKYIYGQLDLIVGMMLHVGVMALGAGTPEISVAYDLRNYSFAKFINHSELVVDLNKLKSGELLKRVKMVYKKKNYYKKEFTNIKEKINNKQSSFLDLFLNSNPKCNMVG